MQKEDSKRSAMLKWLKKFGVAGFLFFLVKGLLWLAVLYFGVQLF